MAPDQKERERERGMIRIPLCHVSNSSLPCSRRAFSPEVHFLANGRRLLHTELVTRRQEEGAFRQEFVLANLLVALVLVLAEEQGQGFALERRGVFLGRARAAFRLGHGLKVIFGGIRGRKSGFFVTEGGKVGFRNGGRKRAFLGVWWFGRKRHFLYRREKRALFVPEGEKGTFLPALGGGRFFCEKKRDFSRFFCYSRFGVIFICKYFSLGAVLFFVKKDLITRSLFCNVKLSQLTNIEKVE